MSAKPWSLSATGSSDLAPAAGGGVCVVCAGCVAWVVAWDCVVAWVVAWDSVACVVDRDLDFLAACAGVVVCLDVVAAPSPLPPLPAAIAMAAPATTASAARAARPGQRRLARVGATRTGRVGGRAGAAA